MQLRFAKKFGFDFAKNSHGKVGVLRSFVRNKKIEERKRRVIQQSEAIAMLQAS